MKRVISYKAVLFFIATLLVNEKLFSQNSTLSGRVRYGNEPLQGATISLAGQTMLSDHNGEFSFSVKPGTHTIIITYAGYRKIEAAIVVADGKTMNFDFEMITADNLAEVIMLGSRAGTQRSNRNTAVPVDIFSSNRLTETGQVSLTQMLNFLSPSFNTSREVLNESATLRGLDPQHVLILVNGIRYHNMAWLFSGNLRGQLGKGSVGNDLNSIPFAAIEKIEVLRDGAAAQYGSDAIAGVINIVLKKAIGKTSAQLHWGQYYKSDGDKFFAGISHGFELKKGFLDLSIAYRQQAPTFRGGSYGGLVYLNYPPNATPDDSFRIKTQDDQLVSSRGFDRRAAIDNAGNTKLNSGGIVINGGLPLNDQTELFWTIIGNSRKLDRGGLFRFPRDSSRINFVLFPDGFQPRNKTNTIDLSVTAGTKGRSKRNWHWDVSSRYGSNLLRSHTSNNNNATQTLLLGAIAPTSFYTGSERFTQLTNDVNVTKQLTKPPAQLKTMNIGYGAEWRFENYRSKEGEEASWYNYDPANYLQGGVGGPTPENAVNKSRNVLGAYVEIETELKKNFLFNIASRYEYYSDYGGNIAGKLAARYKISGRLMVRASVNNGFRAPSLQQRFINSIAFNPTIIGGVRTTVLTGTFPNDHPVIRALDIPTLSAEKTLNISGGISSTFLDHFTLTADAYWIRIKDRVVLSGNFERKPGNTLDAILDPYPAFNEIIRVSFFSNAIHTITKGIDIMLDGNWSKTRSHFGISLAANFNCTRLSGPVKTSEKLAVNPQSLTTLFNSEEITKVEDGQPGSKIILSLTYKTGKTKLAIQNTRFGKTAIAPLQARPENFSAKILTDLSCSYALKQSVTLTAGVNNIANVYPDRLKYYENTSQGSWIYSPEASPFGFNGGYYYLTAILKW